MFRCIHCGAKHKNIMSTRSEIMNCKKCCKKIDGYFEVNNTLLFIDLILSNKTVIRHLLYNSKITKLNNFFFIILIIFSKVFYLYESHFIQLTCVVMLDFLIYFCILNSFFKFKIANFQNIILLSFHYLFLYLMILWKYTDVEFLLMLDFMVIYTNVIGLSVLTDCSAYTSGVVCILSRAVTTLVIWLVTHKTRFSQICIKFM